MATLSYLGDNDPVRDVHPLWFAAARLVDLRAPGVAAALGIDPRLATTRWRDDRAAGLPARSWAVSDAARAAGADGMLYASRKRAELTHLVLYRWNEPGLARLDRAGRPGPFPS